MLRDEFGYELERCTPVDMFPHTPHIESVSLLSERPSVPRVMMTRRGTTTEAVTT